MTKMIVNEINDTLVIKKNPHENFFITTSDSFIIDKANFAALLKFLVFRGFISVKLLHGVIEEFDNLTKE